MTFCIGNNQFFLFGSSKWFLTLGGHMLAFIFIYGKNKVFRNIFTTSNGQRLLDVFINFIETYVIVNATNSKTMRDAF